MLPLEWPSNLLEYLSVPAQTHPSTSSQKKQQNMPQAHNEQSIHLENRLENCEDHNEDLQSQIIGSHEQYRHHRQAPPVPTIYSNSFGDSEDCDNYDDFDDSEWDDDVECVEGGTYLAENNMTIGSRDQFLGSDSVCYTNDKNSENSDQTVNETNTSSRNYSSTSEASDPFDTSHIRCYDEPPFESQDNSYNTDNSPYQSVLRGSLSDSPMVNMSANISSLTDSQINSKTSNSLLLDNSVLRSPQSIVTSSQPPVINSLPTCTSKASVPLSVCPSSKSIGISSTVGMSHSSQTVKSLHNSFQSSPSQSGNMTVSTQVFPLISNNLSSPSSHLIQGIQESSCMKDLNAQISNMWISSISQSPPSSNLLPIAISQAALSSQVEQSHISTSLSSLPSSMWINQQILQSNQGRQVGFPHTSITRESLLYPTQISTLPSVSTRNAQLALPAPLTPTTATLPRLDPAFIAELEKSLGKDQASANTFTDRDKKVNNSSRISVTPSFTVSCQSDRQHSAQNIQPALPSPQQTLVSRQTSLAVAATPVNECQNKFIPDARVQLQPAINNSAFSDLDVLTSSRTLGVLPQQIVDTGQFFPKTAHARPVMQYSPTSTTSLRSIAAGSLGNHSQVPGTTGSLIQQSNTISTASVHTPSSGKPLSEVRNVAERWSSHFGDLRTTPAVSSLSSISPSFQMSYSSQQPQQHMQFTQKSSASSVSSSVHPWCEQQHQSYHHQQQSGLTLQSSVLQPTVVLSPTTDC